jgi:hypothetical protein
MEEFPIVAILMVGLLAAFLELCSISFDYRVLFFLCMAIAVSNANPIFVSLFLALYDRVASPSSACIRAYDDLE